MTALVILIAVFLTAILSAMLGMAGGLVLMGVLALVLPVSAAMVTHGAVQSVSNGWRAVLLRRFILWKALGFYLIGSALAALGMLAVQFALDRAWLLIALGCVPFLVWLPAGRWSLDAARPVHGVAAGFLVTGLNVIAGVSGPLLDVFFQNTDVDRRAIVATKAASQVAAHGVKIAYYAGPAMAVSDSGLIWLIALAVPLSIAGTTLGARVLAGMSEAVFRRWTKRVVTCIGLVYLAMGAAQLMGGGMMELKPAILQNAHVRLEPLVESHREALRAPADDPDIWAFMTQRGDGPHFDAWFDKMLAASAGPSQISHAVIDAASGACVGHTAFLELSAAHARVEIGWTWYVASVRGGLVNPACKHLLLARAFACGAQRVELKTHHLNQRSQRAIARLGAVREGVLRSHYATWTGERRDTVMFSILRAEWPGVQAALEARLSPA